MSYLWPYLQYCRYCIGGVILLWRNLTSFCFQTLKAFPWHKSSPVFCRGALSQSLISFHHLHLCSNVICTHIPLPGCPVKFYLQDFLFFFFLVCLFNSNTIILAHLLVQFSSVAQSCPTLCDPMNHSTPGLPVHHQLPKFTQTHIHRVGDAIQPSHPLSSPSPPAPNPSQHQSLFQWVNSSHELAKELEFQL